MQSLPVGDLRQYHDLRTKTVPELFLRRVKETPNSVAYRAKKLGIYQEHTWEEFRCLVARCAMGLTRLGLKHGERCALLGDPCEEYTICELSAQSLGAVTYGIYPAASQSELQHIIEDGKASFIITGNQEYLDRIQPLCGRLRELRHLIVIDRRGIFACDNASFTDYESLVKDGEGELSERPGAFEEIAARVKPTDGLFIAYTSGTTGHPKGVLVSHGKHVAAAAALVDHYPVLRRYPHRTVVYLPLASIPGKLAALTLPLFTLLIPHYGEDVEEPGQTFFEVAPTVLFTVPGYLKKILAGILIAMENSSATKKAAYAVAMGIARHHLQRVWEGKRNMILEVAHFVCYYTVFRPILNKIGFDKLKLVLSTGTHLPDQVMSLWQIYGVNVAEMYSLAEAGGGIVTAQEGHFPKPGNVGKPLACLEVKLSDSGEILVKGEDLFECYWNNRELTDTCRDVAGWLRTDDAGQWTPDGRLRILDRLGHGTEGGGPNADIAFVENMLKSSPYINEAVVVGQDRDCLYALIEIDFEAVSDWASRHDITFTGFSGLVEHPSVIAHIGSQIDRINRSAGPNEQVGAFRIIPGILTPAEEGAPITPTGKIRRKVIQRKFGSLIESMYKENTKKQGGRAC
jgi:long-chain acyl-CoA synthetase